MKGIIFEINKKKAVAVDSDGHFVNLKNRGYTVGAEIEINLAQTAGRSLLTRFAAVFVTIFLLVTACVCGGLYYSDNYTASYTVQLDINPSVTLFVNAKNTVIKADGNNDDGKSLNPGEFVGTALDSYIVKYIDRFIESDIYNAETEYTVKIEIDGKRRKTDTSALAAKVENTVRGEFTAKDIPVATETENGRKGPDQFNITFCNNYADQIESYTLPYKRGVAVKEPAKPDISAEYAEKGFTFAFWWDGLTLSGDGTPENFFGDGERLADKNVLLFAVWKYNNGYTAYRNSWVVSPDGIVRIEFFLVQPDGGRVGRMSETFVPTGTSWEQALTIWENDLRTWLGHASGEEHVDWVLGQEGFSDYIFDYWAQSESGERIAGDTLFLEDAAVYAIVRRRN